jgi:hypothetical protein
VSAHVPDPIAAAKMRNLTDMAESPGWAEHRLLPLERGIAYADGYRNSVRQWWTRSYC